MKTLITSGITAIAMTISLGAGAAMIKDTDANVRVDARGLDLSSEQGQEMLYSRLQKAAKQICGTSSVSETGSLKRALNNKSCYDETLSKAVEAAGSDTLEAIHKTS